MENKTGVSVKKTKLLDRKVKTDFKKILTSLSKSAIMYYAGKSESAIKESVSLVDAFKFSTDTSDLAYQLIITALVNSAHNLARENSNRFVARFEEHEKLYDDKEYMEFLENITSLVEEKEIVIEYETLKNPRSLSLLESFQQYFSKYLILFGISEKDAELISNRLPSYFVFELNDEWRNNFPKYESIIQKLDAPIAGAARKERQWEAYNTYLEKEVATPVFGESFSLIDIFIPLRAYYKRKKKSYGTRLETGKIAVWLEESLDNWLQSSENKDAIKVIQGGPGSGKSSITKWWTAKVVKDRRIPVLFFPLHHFNIHTNIKTAIGEYFKDSPNIPLEHNPFEDAQTIDRMLLVFDGLDELVMQGKSSREAASAFMQEVKDFCNKFNDGKQRLKVLITGRPISVQNTEAKLRDGDQQIMYLLPYYLTGKQRLEYRDSNKILQKDQRNEWWNRFFTFKGLSNHNLPEELQNEKMDKITIEPLLNYLVALSWKKAPDKFNQDTNINDVYHQLILGVHHRDWDNKRPHRATGDLTSDDFIQILEEIAICAWQGGDARITTERKIEKHIKDRGLESLLNDYKASAKSGVSRLLTAFYFRKFGKEDTEEKDDTFEFTHKSFGEYLAARAIVELIKATHEEREENKKRATSRRDKRKGWTIQQALGEWLRMTSKNTIDKDLNQFVINELSIRKDANEPIEKWQTTLCEVISELIQTGMPLHLQEQRTFHLEETRLARNAEEAILVALSDCARITNQLSKFSWNTFVQPAIWLNRLSTSLSNKDFAFKNLNNIDLEAASLEAANLAYANLQAANLQAADLQAANLVETNLAYANLGAANLAYANLRAANLQEVNLQGTDLERANLAAADLAYANLGEANLERAHLERANLERANLEKTNFRRAHLEAANLEVANLREANLAAADLREANLRAANLEAANLQGTDLRGADLGGADLRKANLVAANLRGANLVAANLQGTDLRGADLQEVDLQEVDLREVRNLVLNQLILTKSLYQTKGILAEIKQQLKKQKPELFQKPE